MPFFLEPTIRVDGGKVDLTYKERPDFALSMDFSAWLESFSGPVVFLHWQKSPRFQRRWGVFSRDALGKTDYVSLEECVIDSKIALARQFDEGAYRSVPSAVLVYESSKLVGNTIKPV